MAVVLKYTGPLEPVQWPTGEAIAVRRPNLHAAELWDTQVADYLGQADKSGELRDGLAAFVALICPSKSLEQIRDECTEEFLWLVANYSRDRLDVAMQFLDELSGKAPEAAPAPAPPASTGTSPVASPEPLAAPCGV